LVVLAVVSEAVVSEAVVSAVVASVSETSFHFPIDNYQLNKLIIN
jgi:hypothetical protein